MKILAKLLAISFAVWISFIPISHAEIVLDGTLESLPGPNYLISDNLGRQSGANLFHSFDSFNLNTGESATFTGNISVKNVITRVTGSHRSWIDGTLRSEIPNADFYFLNPNGIMFGENARLDINGSFYASTADYLRLTDGQHFYVNQSNDFSLLVAPPASFGFLTSTPTDITIQGSMLKIEEAGKDLSFIGGDLNIENSNISTVGGGQINLISVASTGEMVPGLPNTDKKMGTIKILGNSIISGDTEFGTDNQGGDIFIAANQMTMEFDGSCGEICPGISSDTRGNGNSGNININIVEELKMTGELGISTASTEQATGNAGNINLTVGQLSLAKGGFINSSTSTNGNGGHIDITATQGISLSGGGMIASTLNRGSSATEGGNVDIKTPRLEMKDYPSIQTGANYLTTGDAGNIAIHSDDIKLEDNAIILSSSVGSGKSGHISISSLGIELKQSSLMSFSVNAQSGNVHGGNIKIQVRDHLYLQDSGIVTSAIENVGYYSLYQNGLISLEELLLKLKPSNGGNIDISKPQIFVFDKSQILATAKSGQGGNINIEADNFIHSFPYEEGGEFVFELPHVLDFLFDFEKMNFNVSRINASSAFGINGEMSINAIEKDISKDLLHLPEKHQAPRLLLNRCAGFTKENLSRFLIIIRDVLPPTPEDLRTHNYIP